MNDQTDMFPPGNVAEGTVNLAALCRLTRSLDTIFDAITRAGEDGLTAFQLLGMFADNMPYSTITTAPSKLIKMGLCYRRGDRSGGKNGRAHYVIRVENRDSRNCQLSLVPGRRSTDIEA